MRMGDVHNNNTQSIADYLAQLLKDKKQLAAFPNVFIHMERLLDEGELWSWCQPSLHHPSWDQDAAASSICYPGQCCDKQRGYFEKLLWATVSAFFIVCLAGIQRVYLQSEIRTLEWTKSWGLMVMRSCVLIAITTLFPPPSQADATLCHREGVYSVFRIISQSGNNGNNNTVHRAEVRTLRVIMLPGHREREVMKWVPSSPAPAPVTYLTSSSRPAVPGIYTCASGMLGTVAITQENLSTTSWFIVAAFVCCVRIWLVMPVSNLSIIWVLGTMTQDATTDIAPGPRRRHQLRLAPAPELVTYTGHSWCLYSLYMLLFLPASYVWGVETIANECRVKISRSKFYQPVLDTFVRGHRISAKMTPKNKLAF